jgi:NAD(P)H-hydrate repair Nnr-like enzyme with NAD(P)H-hydrate dehydratase domain
MAITAAVLAGIIVSFLAQGMDIIDAVKAAIYVHSNTADMVAKEIGEMALMPSDIIEAL